MSLTNAEKAAIITCAKGSYQIGLLSGIESWSGSTLRGKARHWGAAYWRSRLSLVNRIQAALPHYEVRCQLVLVPSNGGGRRWTRCLTIDGAPVCL